MQMFMRLSCLLAALLLILAGCAARPPVEKLEDVRAIVDHAYASGAAQYAPGEYQLANSALQAAEQQIKNKDYRKAERTLELSQRYSAEALNLTLQAKKELAEEQRRIAEEKRLAELQRERELELQRQAELKKQEELRKQQAKAAAEAARKTPLPEKASPKPVEPVKPKLVDHVEVRAGESLAVIAGRSEVYSDPLLWPLIYKANRDQIKDPKEIFAGQILAIPRDKSRDEIEAARQEARELNLF